MPVGRYPSRDPSAKFLPKKTDFFWSIFGARARALRAPKSEVDTARRGVSLETHFACRSLGRCAIRVRWFCLAVDPLESWQLGNLQFVEL